MRGVRCLPIVAILIGLAAIVAAEEQTGNKPQSKDLCLEVVDAVSKEPVTQFTVLYVGEDPDPFADAFEFPSDYAWATKDVLEHSFVRSSVGRHCIAAIHEGTQEIVIASPGHEPVTVSPEPKTGLRRIVLRRLLVDSRPTQVTRPSETRSPAASSRPVAPGPPPKESDAGKPFPLTVTINGEPARSLQIITDDTDEVLWRSGARQVITHDVEGLVPGSYTLVINHRFRSDITAPSATEISLNTRDLTLEITSAGPSPGHVLPELHSIETESEVRYLHPPRVYNLSEGLWQARDLLEGSYELEVSSPGFRTAQETVVLTEDVTMNVELEPLPLPAAMPESDLDELEASILRSVLGDVHDRIAAAYATTGEPRPRLDLLAQTDTPAVSDGLWEVHNRTVEVNEILEGFDFSALPLPVRLDELARSTGFEPLQLEQLPVIQQRVGSAETTLHLLDEWNTWIDPASVLLAVSRPLFNASGTRAVVSVASSIHDPFHWIYIVEIIDSEPSIVLVAEPLLSC